jgi:serine phosphatase RsbU (regulator of sigma subunit)
MANRVKVLLVDDNPMVMGLLRGALTSLAAVTTATDPTDALLKAIDDPPDLLISDYRMPGMDGFAVTRQIKADPVLHTIPVLLLTGADSAQFVVDGLGAGADDFVTKGSDLEILLARLQALLRVKAYQDQLRKLNHQITRDLQIARRVQEALVPQRVFCAPGLEVRSAYIPSETLSGDFYDYFMQDDLLYLFVADVSGHGLPAAILVSLLKSYIHTEADANTPLSRFMSRLNDFLFSVSLPTQFATAQLFRVGPDGTLHYTNAAHPPFLLFRRASQRAALLEEPSHLLGAMPKMTFDERSTTVAPGDTLFVYTDGLTDRRTAAGEFYSVDRIAALLEAAPDADLSTLYDSIYADVTGFPSTDEFKDDIAFVVTRFQ